MKAWFKNLTEDDDDDNDRVEEKLTILMFLLSSLRG